MRKRKSCVHILENFLIDFDEIWYANMNTKNTKNMLKTGLRSDAYEPISVQICIKNLDLYMLMSV